MQRLVATPERQPVAREIWVTSDGQHWRCLGQFAADGGDGIPYLEAGWGVWCRQRYADNAKPSAGGRRGSRPWQRALTALRSARVFAGSR